MVKIYRFILSLSLILMLPACDKSGGNEKHAINEQPTSGELVNSPSDVGESGALPAEGKLQKADYKKIEWTDLLPDEDLKALENPPDYLAEIEDGSDADQLSSQLKSGKSEAKDRYQQALISKDIRPEFNGRHVRIPGFIVPLEFDDHQTITTFFLVPFFGACLHMPPPPPNQILYAEYEPGIKLDALYDPFWVNGQISTELVENDLAVAAYSMTVAEIEPYTE